MAIGCDTRHRERSFFFFFFSPLSSLFFFFFEVAFSLGKQASKQSKANKNRVAFYEK